MNNIVRYIKSWKVILALALLVGLALVGMQVASANSGNAEPDVIFTKWVTDYPNMAGVVSGDVGAGLFAGRIITRVDDGTITNITADYHINGGTHQFTARVNVN